MRQTTAKGKKFKCSLCKLKKTKSSKKKNNVVKLKSIWSCLYTNTRSIMIYYNIKIIDFFYFKRKCYKNL